MIHKTIGIRCMWILNLDIARNLSIERTSSLDICEGTVGP